MKYIAFLRGVNVGGNSLIKMSDLKKIFEDLGFTNVQTYINSGNVIFEGDRKYFSKIPYKSFIISEKELNRVIENAPNSWKENDLRKYVAFVIDDLSPKDLAKEIKLKENIDYLDAGKNWLYLTTKLDGLTKSSFKDLIKLKFYKSLTIRNYNTILKINKIITS